MSYNKAMIEIRTTEVFDSWYDGLRDNQAKRRIDARLRRISLGNLGDCEPVGSGVSEARIHCGPGYRVYFVQRGPVLIIVLAGGDKSTQAKDIKTAIDLAKEL
jgi:putative addiction module killer protein